jgi:hypothetical protein
MSPLSTVEGVGGGVGFHFFSSGIAVWEGDVGVVALVDDDRGVDGGEERGEAECDEEDVAVDGGVRGGVFLGHWNRDRRRAGLVTHSPAVP